MFYPNCNRILGACQIDGVGWPHNDLADFGVSNNVECAQKCRGQAGCENYAYNRDINHCWLKSKRGEVALLPEILTGINNCAGKIEI